MRLVANKAVIKSKKAVKRFVFSKLNKRKQLLTKNLLLSYLGRVRFLKQHLVVSKKKRFFVQKNLDRKFFVLKELLKLTWLKSAFNLIIVIRSQQEYLRMKDELSFSQLGLLNFKFWHLKKKWILNLFKTNKQYLTNFSVFNGSTLILQTSTLKSLLETLLLFEHRSVSCVGFFIYNRLVWPSYFIEKMDKLPALLFAFKKTVFVLTSILIKKLVTSMLILNNFIKNLVNSNNANFSAINF